MWSRFALIVFKLHDIYGLWARTGLRSRESDGVQIPPMHPPCWEKGLFIIKYGCFLPSAVQKRLNRSISVRVLDSRGPNEAQVQPYSPRGANVPICEGTLALPGEYD